MNSRFKSLEDLDVAFPTEESCVRFLELLKWGDGYPISPYDKEAKVKIKGRKYFCCSTNRTFDAKTKTIFFGTSTPLIKWFKSHLLQMRGLKPLFKGAFERVFNVASFTGTTIYNIFCKKITGLKYLFVRK